MQIIRVGVDIAKSVFHVHAVDRKDQCQWQAKLKRANWVDVLCEKLPKGTLIAMEACASAHHWGRELQKRGHKVRLINAQFVKPYVKSNKNDRIDAEAICEAAGRPTMRFVAVKNVSQQDLQALHRIRSELVKQRTAKANQIRGLVGEYGIVAPKGIGQLRRAIPLWLESTDNGLSENFRRLLAELREDLQRLDERITGHDTQITHRAKTDPVACRLLALRGVGPLTATALAVALGDGSAFRRGRDFSASLGIIPRQHSTGGRDKLLGITKRGNAYLRTLLIHGARTVLHWAAKHTDNLSCWALELAARKHKNVACVALANKMARMAWAITYGNVNYDPTRAAATRNTLIEQG